MFKATLNVKQEIIDKLLRLKLINSATKKSNDSYLIEAINLPTALNNKVVTYDLLREDQHIVGIKWELAQ